MVELCKLLGGDDGCLEEVRMAIAEPETYRKRFQLRLARGGRDETEARGMSWIALIEGLKARGRVVEVDASADPQAVQSAIEELLGNVGGGDFSWDWAGDEELADWWDRDTEVFLTAIAEELEPHALALLELQFNSDTFPLTVVPRQAMQRILAVSRSCTLGGVTPLA